ncbi:MAG: ACP S-malonyltransferase [Opitutales bacterium]
MSVGLLFSGQGAQSVGMGASLNANNETARRLYQTADQVLGWSLSKICFEGPEAELTETRVCQPALYVMGAAITEILGAQGKLGTVSCAFGLSLGELTALQAAGVYDFETGLRLVAERGRLMQDACERSPGSMAVLIGGDRAAADELVAACDLDIANLNCPGQIVISGRKAGITEAVDKASGLGFKMAKELNVAGAYHSRLMQSAADAFAEFIRDTPFVPPKVPVYSNFTGQAVDNPAAIKEALIAQIVSPVRFEACLRHAVADTGCERFYECGPGGVLAGLVKRTDRSWTVESLAEYEDLA